MEYDGVSYPSHNGQQPREGERGPVLMPPPASLTRRLEPPPSAFPMPAPVPWGAMLPPRPVPRPHLTAVINPMPAPPPRINPMSASPPCFPHMPNPPPQVNPKPSPPPSTKATPPLTPPERKPGPYDRITEVRIAPAARLMFDKAHRARKTAEGGGVGSKRCIDSAPRPQGGAHVVFLIDGSGSMRYTDARDTNNHAISRADAVFDCCLSFVDAQLAQQQQQWQQGGLSHDVYSIIRFDDKATVLLGTAPLDAMLPQSIRAIKGNFAPRNGTKFGPAFRELQRLVKGRALSTGLRPQDLMVIFLSDGRPGDLHPDSGNLRPLEPLEEFVRELDAGTRLQAHTVLIGDETGAHLWMHLIAELLQGQFHRSTMDLARTPAVKAEPPEDAGGRGGAGAVMVKREPPTLRRTSLADTFSTISTALTVMRSGKGEGAGEGERVKRRRAGSLEAPDAGSSVTAWDGGFKECSAIRMVMDRAAGKFKEMRDDSRRLRTVRIR
jgi:hypothetical protein